MKRPESSIVLLLMVMAIILAIGVFLMISIIMERPDSPEQATLAENPTAYTVQVNGETITLQVDPNQRAVIITEAPQPVPETAVQPTAQPEVQAAPQSEAAPAVQPATGGLPADHVTFISYQVQTGNTLFSIQTNNITSIALMAKYGIDATDIVVGNILNLPVGNPTACGDWRPYVVLQGDTSFGLAQAFNTTLAELQARNSLDANYSIYETQVICVP